MEAKIDWECNKEIQYFQEYLRIKSVYPNPDYDSCIDFLMTQAELLELTINIYYPLNKKNPVVVLTWEGLEPEFPSILLHSHMDVVPVFPDKWTHPPFGAELDTEERIFARGAQNMKCVGMQYLAAIRFLKENGARFLRTIHISFSSDKERGGSLGMQPFVESDQFKSLNVGFSLDEGLASPTEEFPVFYGERSIWRFKFIISGTGGHASMLLKNTVGEKLEYILNKMMEIRKKEEQRLETNPELTIGDVTTINLTCVNGGLPNNLVPSTMSACFDCRLALDVDQKEFEAQLNAFCEEAGGGITIEYEYKFPKVESTILNENNLFWVSFKNAFNEMDLKMKTQIYNDATDSRFIRNMGIPAVGFSPIPNTPVLLHDNDEFIKAEIFVKGVEIYKKIIQKLANTPLVAPDTPDDAPADAPADTTAIPVSVTIDAPDTSVEVPADIPAEAPIDAPTDMPTDTPTDTPTDAPPDTSTDESPDGTPDAPTDAPTEAPTDVPNEAPTDAQADTPTEPAS